MKHLFEAGKENNITIGSEGDRVCPKNPEGPKDP